MGALHVGLIGDFDVEVMAHRAIPVALRLAGTQVGCTIEIDWLATDAMPDAPALSRFDALWCVPASPYRDEQGALRAIRHAREHDVPFLGTCGGFQYAVIEISRNLLGIDRADHAETAPASTHAVISRLACSLVEVSEAVSIAPGSRVAAAYGGTDITEGYRCNFGLNPAYAAQLLAGPLRAAAHGAHGEVRAVELDAHPFFVATLFQPERAALRGVAPPLSVALVRAAAARRGAEPCC